MLRSAKRLICALSLGAVPLSNVTCYLPSDLFIYYPYDDDYYDYDEFYFDVYDNPCCYDYVDIGYYD